jgi:hypothetical protein
MRGGKPPERPLGARTLLDACPGATPSLSIDEARSKIAAWHVDYSTQRISSCQRT